MRKKDVITPGTENYTPHLWAQFHYTEYQEWWSLALLLFISFILQTHTNISWNIWVDMAEISVKKAKDIKATKGKGFLRLCPLIWQQYITLYKMCDLKLNVLCCICAFIIWKVSKSINDVEMLDSGHEVCSRKLKSKPHPTFFFFGKKGEEVWCLLGDAVWFLLGQHATSWSGHALDIGAIWLNGKRNKQTKNPHQNTEQK